MRLNIFTSRHVHIDKHIQALAQIKAHKRKHKIQTKAHKCKYASTNTDSSKQAETQTHRHKHIQTDRQTQNTNFQTHHHKYIKETSTNTQQLQIKATTTTKHCMRVNLNYIIKSTNTQVALTPQTAINIAYQLIDKTKRRYCMTKH